MVNRNLPQDELFVSIGNTNIYYAVFSTNTLEPLIVKKQHYPHSKKHSPSDFSNPPTPPPPSYLSSEIKTNCREIISALKKVYNIKGAYLSSVNPSLNDLIKNVLDHELNISTYIITYHDLHINTDYHTATMGIDRLLKIYVAHLLAPQSNVIIIDFGTAITFDVVKHSKHLGGMIISGFHTALRALHTFTEQLPLLTMPSVNSNNLAFLGNNTENCILNGSFHFYHEAINGLINKTMLEYFQDEKCKVWVTGGDGQYFYRHLNQPVEYLEHLNLTAIRIVSQKLNHVQRNH